LVSANLVELQADKKATEISDKRARWRLDINKRMLLKGLRILTELNDSFLFA